MESDDRLTKLETALAHHDLQIQDLSDVIEAQRREIDLLGRRMAQLQAKLVDLQTAPEDSEKQLSPADQALRDKPPHY